MEETAKETATLFRIFQLFGQLVPNIAILYPNIFLWCAEKLLFQKILFRWVFFKFYSNAVVSDTKIKTTISYFIHNNKLLTFPNC